jgi:hypothetical protein
MMSLTPTHPGESTYATSHGETGGTVNMSASAAVQATSRNATEVNLPLMSQTPQPERAT